MSARAAHLAALAIAASIVSATFATTVAAASSETERRARTHFKAGEERFKAGAFAEALAEYQAGYDVLPLPGFLINVAQCQRRLGDLKTARATYQKFVLVAPDSPLVPQVRSMIAEIDGLLADIEKNKSAATPPEGEAKPVDEPPPPPTAAPPPAATPPASEVTTPVLVETPTPRTEPEPARRRWWLWGALGAVVVGGAVTAIVLSTGGTTTISDGSLATLRR